MTGDQDDSPWADPMVLAALKDGREPSDIALLLCPDCGVFGYYNEGSRFYCRMCDKSFGMLCDDEEPDEDGLPYLRFDEGDLMTLADYEDCEPDGYGH